MTFNIFKTLKWRETAKGYRTVENVVGTISKKYGAKELRLWELLRKHFGLSKGYGFIMDPIDVNRFNVIVVNSMMESLLDSGNTNDLWFDVNKAIRV